MYNIPMPDLSLIIPIYNMEDTLEDCLRSVYFQNFDSLEVLCINDGSTDDSLSILNRYIENDPRFSIIQLDRNYGTGMARKRGVELSKGRYIIFLDADDVLEANACRELYNLVIAKNVDIYHFMPIVENVAGLPELAMEKLNNFVTPFKGYIRDAEILKKCFLDHNYSHILWNKVFNGELVRKSFYYYPEERLIVSEDFVAFFIISFFAKSYYGDLKSGYYVYRYGFGICGSSEMNITQQHFLILCNTKVIYEQLIVFTRKMNLELTFKPILDEVKYSLLESCFDYSRRLDEPSSAMLLLNTYWSQKDIKEFTRIKRKRYLISFIRKIFRFFITRPLQL